MMLLPEVVPVISSARMMSTPEPTSVESVREKRAMPTLRITAPIPTGAFIRKRSQTRRPFSVFFSRRNPKIIAPNAGKMMNQ